MKIVCDNCATKYSIADEKVKGKVFKIRCKKCSHIIVVRGGEGAGDAPADAAPSRSEVTGGGEAVWHLVIDREQIGPITADEVRAKFAAGEIDVETYSWREGFADWLRLGSIEDFADLAKAAPAAAAAAPAPVAPPPSSSKDLFGGDEAGDLFGAQSQSTTVDTPEGAAAGGMFGGGNGASKQPEPMAAAPSEPAPAPRAKKASQPSISVSAGAETQSADSPKMTGQRNENSMLFSLSSLQSMATGSAPSSSSSSSKRDSTPPPSGGVDTRPGFANSQSEGSGLIDIRAMAASTLKKKGDDKEEKSSGADMPSFSAPPVFSPVAAPILMPAPQAGAPKWLWPVVGLGAVAVLGIVGLGIVMMLKQPTVAANPPTPQPVAAQANPTPNTTSPTPPPVNPTQPNAATPTPAQPNPTPTPPVAAAADKGGKKHGDKKGDKPEAGKPEAKASPKPDTPAPAPAPSPGKRKGGDELDKLLNEASPGESKPKKAEREDKGGDDLPDQLDKAAIVGGMGKVKGSVASCYVQYKVPGVVSVSVTIAKSGKVQSANVTGSFEGTPTGGCVEKAVKGASFPQFKGPSQTVNYPFMLR